MTNQYLGLARGPIDHNASSVINSISNEAIEMGSAIVLIDINTLSPVPAEILPRVEEGDAANEPCYGIAVGGDTDGIYSTTGVASGSSATLATESAGQGVVIVTQGRCLARVDNQTAIAVGAQLALTAISTGIGPGVLGGLPLAGDLVIARALQPIAGGGSDTDIIAVDVQREQVV